MSAEPSSIKPPSVDLSVEEQIARLTAAQEELAREIATLRNYVIRKAEPEISSESDLRRRVSILEQAVRNAQSHLNLILESRIWKTLQTGGSIALGLMKLAPSGRRLRVPGAARVHESGRSQDIRIQCDTLPSQPADPLSGSIEIAGWALSRHGISSVEMSIDGGLPIAAVYGLARQDLPVRFPDVPDALHSGFILQYDTRELSDGIHRVAITAHSKNGKTQAIEAPLLVNQAFADAGEYSRWIETFDFPDPELVRLRIASFTYLPVVSILVPVYRTVPRVLQSAIESALAQSYSKLELCIVDDGSGDEAITRLLESFERLDSRVKIASMRERSGISAASNRALEMAAGDYVALLDHDDVLAPDALFHVVDALQRQDRADVLYSDEDHMDESGRRFAPFFKPDWSPDLILSENYICHLMCFRRELALTVGGFRTEFDVSQDHDILLRLSRVANRVEHIPRVLYHWRTNLVSMKRASLSEDRAFDSSRRVVQSYVEQNFPQARVEEGLYSGRWRVRYPIPVGARVSILIPTAGKMDVLERNLKSLWKLAGSTPYEVVVIDNSKSSGSRTILDYVDKLRLNGKPVRHFDQRNEPFNYSRLNNKAAAACSSSLLLFLNDDTEGISEGWLDAMVELAARPDVGAVGAKLLYPDGRIQHAGVTMGLAGICGHSFQGGLGEERHYYDFPDLIRNVSAVTAACVMARTEVFQEVRGFEEGLFPIAYNDIDLCLRIGAAGYRVLYTPHAQLYHYEAHSKSDKELHPHPAETLALKSRWRGVIARDPFYNPNLTRHRENWSLRWD